MVSTFLVPRRPVWLLWTVGLALVVLAWWTTLVLMGARGASATGDRWGLAFGSCAAGLCFAQALYPLRRRWMARPFRTAQDWLQFHVYASTLAFVFVLAHVGLRTPTGLLGWLLIACGGWTFASGMGGILIQKSLPPAVAELYPEHVPYERLPDAVAHLRDDADAAVGDGSAALTAWYQASVRSRLDRIDCSWSDLVGRAGRERAMLASIFDRAPAGAETDAARLTTLRSIVERKLRLDARASLQRVLRWWPVLHVPSALALVGLILWHIFAVAYF
jgi:hypothetical protein